MKTANKIRTCYTAAKMLGKGDDLEIIERDDFLEVRKDDETGNYTSDWTIWVDTTAARQVAWLYIPRTGEEKAIRAADAEAIIVLGNDPGRYF